jgi:TPR repeat protein
MALALLLTSARQLRGIDGESCLGTIYVTGDGVDVDLHETVKWYTRAAEAGDFLAQKGLSFCYKFGDGVAVDLEESKKWEALAAVPR